MKKKRQACKPGSVILTSSKDERQGLYHLSCQNIAALIVLQPTPPDSLVRREQNGPFCVPQQRQTSGYTWLCNPRDVRLMMLPSPPVRFYRTFSPVPQYDTSNRGGYFLLRYYPLSKIFPLRSTVPCIARTFLPLSCVS